MSEKANHIVELLAPTVQALGLELLGIEYLPAPGGATSTAVPGPLSAAATSATTASTGSPVAGISGGRLTRPVWSVPSRPAAPRGIVTFVPGPHSGVVVSREHA